MALKHISRKRRLICLALSSGALRKPEYKRGYTAYAYSAEPQCLPLYSFIENFSRFQTTRISITLLFSIM